MSSNIILTGVFGPKLFFSELVLQLYPLTKQSMTSVCKIPHVSAIYWNTLIDINASIKYQKFSKELTNKKFVLSHQVPQIPPGPFTLVIGTYQPCSIPLPLPPPRLWLRLFLFSVFQDTETLS